MKSNDRKRSVLSWLQLRRMAAALLALALVLTGILPAMGQEMYAYAASGSGTRAASTIADYPLTVNKTYSSAAKITANISPAKGRTVKLQRYNSSKGTWTTFKSVKAGKAYSARVTLSIPKKQRKKTTSIWRIYVPATKKYAAVTSGDITVTTRNIKNYKLTARAACVYRIDEDGKGTLIYTKNSNKELAQASTTKLMTAVLLVESGLLNTTTTISSHAAKTPWGSGKFKKGEVYNTGDLLYAMMLPSSNESATAVAERVGGSESAFVTMMNAKARSLGFTHTNFRNPHGLDANGHYTTALELAKLTAHAYTYPEIRTCWATKSHKIKCLNKKKSWTLWSTNAIFSYISNFLGGKTGTEDNAKCCFTGVYTYGGKTYVTVVLGSNYGVARWTDTKKLHTYIRKYAAGRY